MQVVCVQFDHGGGENATILHYVENNRPFKDVTCCSSTPVLNIRAMRPISANVPVNGKYSQAQRDVYDVVLDVQQQCIEATTDSNTVLKRQELSIELLTEGMKKLGLLKGKTKELIKTKAYMKYYMHGVGHYLGWMFMMPPVFYRPNAQTSRPFAPGMG